MRTRFPVIAFVLLATLVLSCTETEVEDLLSDTLTPGQESVVKRAYQLASIQWTPKSDVPTQNGAVFHSGVQVTGLPYSSVKELDKFIGHDVSLHTFMTAVNNPRSVLYTENVGKAPYKGTNCSTYYGTVCSTTAMYAIGIHIPYNTNLIPSVPGIVKVGSQDPSEVSVGDLLLGSGHIFVVVGVKKRGSSLETVSLLDSSLYGTKITSMNLRSFKSKWKQYAWQLYRYTKLEEVANDYTPSPYVAVGDESVSVPQYNNDICTSRGDLCVYRADESIEVDILSDGWDKIVLSKEGSVVGEYPINGTSYTFSSLSPGTYAVKTTSTGRSSSDVGFIVADVKVDTSFNGSSANVSFSSEVGEPEYIALCSASGSKIVVKELSDSEKYSGTATIGNLSGMTSFYCKVYYKTPYGTVTNSPILVMK